MYKLTHGMIGEWSLLVYIQHTIDDVFSLPPLVALLHCKTIAGVEEMVE